MTAQNALTERLRAVVSAVAPLDHAAMREAAARQGELTKPAGSLGALEEVSVVLAGIAGGCPPPALTRPAVALFAGDHGVHAQGVSRWPQEVTAAMVENIRVGGAAVNVLARQVGADVHVVDVGVAGDLAPGDEPRNGRRNGPGGVLWRRRIRRGTSDLATGPAMTRLEALRGLVTGIEVADDLAGRGYDCLLTGDLGIANTTPSAALVAAYTGADPERVTGRGAGADDRILARKVAVVRAAVGDRPPGTDPVTVLASVGGFEHAGLAGLVLGGAARRLPVILDGLIAGSAALAAQALAPGAVRYCFAGHRSVEPGHAVALASLGLRPLVDLDLRLGEGTGAVLAFPVVAAAGAVLREMATFDSAGVTRKAGR